MLEDLLVRRFVRRAILEVKQADVYESTKSKIDSPRVALENCRQLTLFCPQ